MNGPEHYKAAESLEADACQPGLSQEWVMARLARAQVHATLALAAATVATRTFGPQELWGGHSIEVAPEWQQATE